MHRITQMKPSTCKCMRLRRTVPSSRQTSDSAYVYTHAKGKLRRPHFRTRECISLPHPGVFSFFPFQIV